MWPTGDFQRFRNDIIERYPESGTITFGVLIADARQSESKEYITNYLRFFHTASGAGFDFFIPGYTDINFADETRIAVVTIGQTEYFFSPRLFDDFITGLENIFGIRYTFNPMLILFEVADNHFGEAKKKIVRLDTIKGGVRQSGELFRKIFDAVNQRGPQIDDIEHEIGLTYLKGNWISMILNVIKLPVVKELHDRYKDFHRF